MQHQIEAFKNLSFQEAKAIADQFGTPCYIFDQKALLDRFNDFNAAIKKYYAHSQIALSYKTNPLRGITKLLHQKGAFAEVVSGVEYALAQDAKIPGEQIIFNGPMKTDLEIETALLQNSLLHCDHLEEVKRIGEIARKLNLKALIGLRLYFPAAKVLWHRFGLAFDVSNPECEAFKAISHIVQNPNLELSGLHAHIGTNIRDIDQFKTLGEQLTIAATYLKAHDHIELQWLDVGGGLAGISPRIDEQQFYPHPAPDLDTYAKAIITPMLPYLNSLSKPATLYFEPGRTIYEPCAGLLMKIMGIRDQTDQQQSLIVDVGINGIGSTHMYNHPLQHFKDTSSLIDTAFYGPTCNQVDQIHEKTAFPKHQRGDLLFMQGVGAYSIVFSYNFIRFRPGVLLWQGDTTCQWLRRPETLKDLTRLEYDVSL